MTMADDKGGDITDTVKGKAKDAPGEKGGIAAGGRVTGSGAGTPKKAAAEMAAAEKEDEKLPPGGGQDLPSDLPDEEDPRLAAIKGDFFKHFDCAWNDAFDTTGLFPDSGNEKKVAAGKKKFNDGIEKAWKAMIPKKKRQKKKIVWSDDESD